ncbi:hypothetical protein B0H19DRAFT_1060341 [Mycena capillaripes]|nr:hypothetical protein B0H19DRAFT_1060341 [Mycena capillaripes]
MAVDTPIVCTSPASVQENDKNWFMPSTLDRLVRGRGPLQRACKYCEQGYKGQIGRGGLSALLTPLAKNGKHVPFLLIRIHSYKFPYAEASEHAQLGRACSGARSAPLQAASAGTWNLALKIELRWVKIGRRADSGEEETTRTESIKVAVCCPWNPLMFDDHRGSRVPPGRPNTTQLADKPAFIAKAGIISVNLANRLPIKRLDSSDIVDKKYFLPERILLSHAEEGQIGQPEAEPNFKFSSTNNKPEIQAIWGVDKQFLAAKLVTQSKKGVDPVDSPEPAFPKIVPTQEIGCLVESSTQKQFCTKQVGVCCTGLWIRDAMEIRPKKQGERDEAVRSRNEPIVSRERQGIEIETLAKPSNQDYLQG